jgi:hypothetical protein
MTFSFHKQTLPNAAHLGRSRILLIYQVWSLSKTIAVFSKLSRLLRLDIFHDIIIHSFTDGVLTFLHELLLHLLY